MGKIIVSVILSVDGYAEGPAGDLSVMPMSEAFNEHNAERIREAHSLLYGATTYRQMVGYWPAVPGNTDASAAEQEIARRMALGMPVTAISDTLSEEETGPWRGQTTIVTQADAHEAVAALRRKDGDTVIFGSQTVWTDLLAHGLVDDLYVMIGPKLVAGDRPAFAGTSASDLHLVGIREYGEVGTVVLHYEVVRSEHADDV